jgi:hypothetical protein
VTGALTLLRALLHRAGTTVVILVVALCATAAATVGPTYYVAARHSILQDTLTATSVVGRGFQAVRQGPVQSSIGALDSNVTHELDQALGGPATVRRVFAPAVLALEATAFFPNLGENVPLVWRTDVCAHLRFRSGRCGTATGEVAVSASLAALNHWQTGQRVQAARGGPLTITGIYLPPDASGDYWFSRGGVYFPAEIPIAQAAPYDALFTPHATIDVLPGNPQGSTVIARALDVPRVTPADVDALGRLDSRLNNASLLNGVAVATGLSSTVDTVHSSWSSLSVPVIVVTAELLVLTWLLLFLVVTDAVEARGTEIALAKLRGYGAARAFFFGLGEPLTLLALALPAGAVIGWALTGVLSHVLLRAGTPVPLPGLGWAGATAAAAGGVAAVVVAARTTLTRPVVEQWRRTGRKATDRGRVFDAVVLTGAAAGLAQLLIGGSLGSAKHSALALLVPGLLGLAIAVVGSRLLPVICRAWFARTRRRGGLGPFLAVRHIARRPGGTRTTMILATAVALATFSLAAWSVASNNRARVAEVTVGAPTVFSVAPDIRTDLGAVVDHIDPGGHAASAVETFNSGQSVLVAVQPQRFAAVAHWKAGFVSAPAALLGGLHPPAPDPVVLQGDKVRVHLDVNRLQPAADRLSLDIVATGASSPTPIDLGVITRQHVSITRVGSLAGCPCTVRDLQFSPPASRPGQITGDVTLTGLEVLRAGSWQSVPHALDPGQWSDTADQQVVADGNGQQVHWSFFAVIGIPPTLSIHDRPDPLPAVAASAIAGTDSTLTLSGLDGADLTVAVTGRVANVPAAPANGVVVDLTYAERAAFGNLGPATAQVWVRGDRERIRRGLQAAHIPILSTRTSAEADAELTRQGPGLASVLFLADAGAAAVLAALAAVLSLSAAARRRRYEYAALAATGASRRTLFTALVLEQLVVVGFGALTGVGAGLLAVVIAGRSVPEFVVAPVAALLRYGPSPLLMVLALGGGFVLLLTSAGLAAAALLRSVTAEQLREAPA